jgi:P4 family phage/plasmid primase-like protien
MTTISAGDGKVLVAGIALRKRGYFAHLIHPEKKRPIGDGWGLARWDEDKLRETAGRYPGAGVGIALGPGRAPGGGWLIDAEVDGPEGEDSLDTLLGGERPETPSWGSARGDHTLFTVDGHQLQKLLVAAGAEEGKDPKGKGAWHLPELPGLELRTGGYKGDGAAKQVQSVVPPTVGTDGKPRAWKVSPRTKVAELPGAAYAFLEDLAERKAIQGEGMVAAGDGQPPGGNGKAGAAARQGLIDAYAAGALRAECDAVEHEPEGGRNDRLNVAAYNLGQLVGARALVRSEVEKALSVSAKRAGLGEAETRRTIKSGLDDGTARPRDLSRIDDGRYRPSSNGDGHHGTAVATDAALAKHPRTDTGNAERMFARFGTAIRYCHAWKKFLRFDGCRWVLDDIPGLHNLAKKTARKILAEAATIANDKRRTALIKWARQSEGRSRLGAMIALLIAEDGVATPKDAFDSHPWLLNVENGTIDLQTGRLRPHRRDDLITMMVPVRVEPDAKCPLWDATLHKVFAGNAGLIGFWDRLCGLALTGVTHEQILPILWGGGSNGKSTIVKTLVNLLGPDFAMIAPPGLLIKKHTESHPTERATLYGKRLVVEMETEQGVRLNENLIKHLTGGDPITCRRMNEDFWSFDPTHKLMLCTNHKPEVRGTDHAIWRRPKLVPFTVTIPESEAITDMPARLRAEYPGILARCVRGCLDWQRNGLGVPSEVVTATDQYRVEQDVLSEFIKEECVVADSLSAKATPLYERYRQWAGSDAINQRTFGKAMSERGFERYQSNGTWYRGIGLCAPAKADDDDSD